MPDSSLFDFLRVKNIRAEVSLGGVKNTRDSKPDLHPRFLVLFMQESLFSEVSASERFALVEVWPDTDVETPRPFLFDKPCRNLLYLPVGKQREYP